MRGWFVLVFTMIVQTFADTSVDRALRATDVERLETLIQTQASTIQSLQARLGSYDNTIRSLQTLIIQQDVTLHQLSDTVRQQERAILALQSQRDADIHSLQNQCQQLNTSNAVLHDQVQQQDLVLQQHAASIQVLENTALARGNATEGREQTSQNQSVECQLAGRCPMIQALEMQLDFHNLTLLNLQQQEQRLDASVRSLQAQVHQQDIVNVQQAAAIHDARNELYQQYQAVQLGLEKQMRDLNATLRHLQDLVGEHGDIAQQQQTLQVLQQDLQNLTHKQAQTAGFYVDFGATPYHVVRLHAASPVPFNNVVTNAGGAYDPVTACFTAPWRGLYSFRLQFMGGVHRNDTELAVYVDDAVLAYAYAEGDLSDNNDQGGCTAVVRLSGGERVSVRLSEGYPEIWGSHLTSFSGFLIHSD